MGLPFRFGKGRKKKQVITQLSGRNTGENVSFIATTGVVAPVTLRNWYMEAWFGEKKMLLCGFTLCLGCMLMAFAILVGGVFHA